jgi:hypothetical protein
MPDIAGSERSSPLALVGVTVGSLLLFAAVFVGFLVAPIAVLLLFAAGFAAAR